MRALNIGLWAAQVVLALMFGSAGVMKATQPISELAAQLVWPGAVPEALVRFIGPIAAAGLVTTMVLASIFHLTRGEFGGVVFNVVLGSVAAFIAWGRWRRAPISS